MKYVILLLIIALLSACTSQQQITGDSTLNITKKTIAIHEEVLQQHSGENDCWVVYKQQVFDITKFLPQHPGGKNKIVPYCGTTGFEKAFFGKHGTDKERKFYKENLYLGEFSI